MSEESALVVLPKNTPFPTELKELIYEIWLFLADRSAGKAMKLLEQRISSSSPGEFPYPVDRLPTVRRVQQWIKEETWDERANDHIRDTAKHIDETQISRMFVISDLALSFAHQLLENGFNEKDHAGVLAVKWDAAKEMLRFRGLGTAGVMGAPTLEVKVTTEINSAENLTIEERSEMMRQGILTSKEQRRLTGRTKN